MHVLIAPNAFKNSLAAEDAARAIQRGLEESGLSCTTECFPIADGGDGTGRLLVERLKGSAYTAKVHDPLNREITAEFGIVNNDTAIIEMASASGLRLLHKMELDPLHASTIGTGELMLASLDKGAREIILTVGGSATVDGGAGIMHALGARYFDEKEVQLHPCPDSLRNVNRIDLSGLDPRLKEAKIIVLCDVDIPLLGPRGTASNFSPQKGASPADVLILEEYLTRLNDLLYLATRKNMSHIPFGGAAGGVSAGLWAMLGARLEPGADCFLDKTSFDASLKRADLLITGEGSLDAQTLWGKAPHAVAKRARALHIPVYALTGKVDNAARAELSKYFDELIEINPQGISLADALARAEANLENKAKELGNRLSRSLP